jgi:hypothetical protein
MLDHREPWPKIPRACEDRLADCFLLSFETGETAPDTVEIIPTPRANDVCCSEGCLRLIVVNQNKQKITGFGEPRQFSFIPGTERQMLVRAHKPVSSSNSVIWETMLSRVAY